MTEERRKELVGIINRICYALTVVNSYADSEEKFNVCFGRVNSILISNGICEFAEALGIDLTIGEATLVGKDISKEYSFTYRGIEFYDYVKIASLEEM